MIISLRKKILHLNILNCIKYNDLEGLQSIINQNKVNIDKIGGGYNKPLIYAIQNIPKNFDNTNNNSNSSYNDTSNNDNYKRNAKPSDNEDILMEWREKREDILRYLIDLTENLNFEVGPDGETPLFLALKYQYFSIAKYLLQDEKELILERKKFQRRKLNREKSDEYKSINCYPSLNPNERLVDINYKNQKGQNVLFYLFQQEAMTPFALKLAMKKGIHINDVDPQNKSLLIHIVEGYGYPNSNHYQMLQYLQMIIQYYIFPSSTVLKLLIFYKNRIALSTTQLEELVAKEYQRLQVDIKDNEDSNPLRDGSNTALLKAVKRHDVGAIQLLLQCRPNLEIKDNYGRTALMFLFMDGYKSLAQKLLDAGAEVNARDKDHRTPLFMACEHRQAGAAELFLKYGADPATSINLNIANSQIPQTAIQIAVERGYEKIVDLLLRHGIDPNKPVQIISSSLPNGGNEEGHSKEITTLLILACRKGHERIVRSLLEHGADPEIKDSHQKTGFQYAYENNHIEILKIFEEFKKK